MDSSFTQGSKDFFGLRVNVELCQTKGKNDIANAAVAIIGNTIIFCG